MSGVQLSMSSVILNSVDKTKSTMNNVQTQLTTGKKTLDAAEEGVVTRLSSQINGFNAAENNITKSQNIISVAQTGLKSISDILIQMKDLAGKTNDSTMSTADKEKLNQTFAKLLKQVDDLAKSSQVDGVSLLSGTATDMKVQTGLTSTDQFTVTAQKVDTTTLGISALDISATGNSAAAVDALQSAIDSVSSSQSSLAADKIGLNARNNTISGINDNLQATIDTIQKPNAEALQTQLNELNAQQSINYYLINQTNQQIQSMLSIFR